jgi:hypothetical protein
VTPTRYRECLTALGISQRGLAPYLDCSDRLTRAWATGAVTIPPLVAEWLEAWVGHRMAHPDPLPPKDWRRLQRTHNALFTSRAEKAHPDELLTGSPSPSLRD